MAFDLDDEELKATRNMPCNKQKASFSTTKKGENENDKSKKDKEQANK